MEQLVNSLSRREDEKALEIIKNHPELDLASLSDGGSSLLHIACDGDCHRVVSLLLKVKGVDINRLNNEDASPFVLACMSASVKSLAVLLNDPRLDLVSHDFWFRHLLTYSRSWCPDLLSLWIASGRPIEPKSQAEEEIEFLIYETYDDDRKDDIKLLRAYLENPRHAAFLASIRLGRSESLASLFFAPVIFLSDGLLQFRKEEDDQKLDEQASKTVRFLKIARVLPLELQMLLCHRVVNSAKVNIPSNISEVAFQKLV